MDIIHINIIHILVHSNLPDIGKYNSQTTLSSE